MEGEGGGSERTTGKSAKEIRRSRKHNCSVAVCRCVAGCRTPTPDTNVTPPPPFLFNQPHTHTTNPQPPNSSITICMAPLAPDYANHLSSPSQAPKMGVFSSRLAPNAASPGPEVYIHTLLNGQILPRCCLHSGPTQHPHPHPKKKRSYSTPMDSRSKTGRKRNR